MPAQPISSVFPWQETSTLLEGKRESATLEAIVREHARFVFKVAYGVLRNSHDAEDVVQEVFLRVHRTGTNDVRDMRAWLARVTFRLALDRTRKPDTLDIAEFELTDAAASAEHETIHRQQLQRMHALISALPADLRYPLVLSAIEELNSREIGEILDTPESSVRGRIARARQLLKEKLAVMEKRP